MPRLRNTGTGCVVNVDDETAARLIRREFDMGTWEPLDAPDAETDDPKPVKRTTRRRK